MTRTDQLSERLSAKSRELMYDVYKRFEWSEELGADQLGMSPELTTLYGTEFWDGLTDEQIRRLTICETGNLFANTLHGERALVAGLSDQLYGKKHSPEVTDYLHHFLDEENKHMVMFGLYCRKYVGRVYPEKKLSFGNKEMGPGEDLIGFYAMAMVVEDFGDYFNIRTMKDDRCDPLVRDISQLHHMDESRHLAFDRAYLTDLCEQWLPEWDEAQKLKFSTWLGGFMKSNFATYYNPAIYKDIGLDGHFKARRAAMEQPYQKELRAKVADKLTRFFSKIGLLLETPEV